MSDLISRQAFLDFIESVPFLLEHQNLKGIAIDWIKQQPTAYDIDKVVEQIEDAGKYGGFTVETEEDGVFENFVAVSMAKEIVKGGGISE